MIMTAEQDERLRTELSLLEAMYPDAVMWNEAARELKYSSDGNSFHLRLPDSYLVDSMPEVLSASVHRVDVRNQLVEYIRSCQPGEEILDSIISALNDLKSNEASTTSSNISTSQHDQGSTKATVIVWLHHLLNTNKRKQALSPPSQEVSGLTKPGYPGVLVYSGPSLAVYEHVNELKALNWQAFQVRFESEEEWSFAHGSGVKEVEAMKEIVAEIGDERKEEFMEAMRMK